HCYSIGRREKYNVTAVQVRLRGVREGQIGDAPQTREDFGNRRPGFLARRDHDKIRFRMAGENPQQLDSGVTRSPDDADLDHLLPQFDIAATAGNPSAANDKQKSRLAAAFVLNSLNISVWSIACAAAPCADRPSFARPRGRRESRARPC